MVDVENYREMAVETVPNIAVQTPQISATQHSEGESVSASFCKVLASRCKIEWINHQNMCHMAIHH